MTQCDYPRATLEIFKKYETVAKLQPGWRGFIFRHKKSVQELVPYGEFVMWSAPSGVYTLLSAGEFSMRTIRRRVLADNEVYESSVSILVFLESFFGDLIHDNELFGRKTEACRAILDHTQYELYLKTSEQPAKEQILSPTVALSCPLRPLKMSGLLLFS